MIQNALWFIRLACEFTWPLFACSAVLNLILYLITYAIFRIFGGP